ncbi:sugar ABC transporter ATP-binding protein [Rhizobium sp.]
MAYLTLETVEKSFGATRALDGTSFALERGEIVCLMGANGAGKSTLVNIVAGALASDGGRMTLDGAAYAPRSPAEAAARGVVTVHQSTDRLGTPGLSVADNLLLDGFADGTVPFLLSRGSVRARAALMLRRAGFELPLDRDFADLPPAERQLLAIARAVARDASLLILDEPTASLSRREAERLYAVLGDLRRRGHAILYISHRLGDLEALADRVVVMRGGRIVHEAVRPIDFDKAIEAMIGRSIHAVRGADSAVSGPPVFSLQDVRLRSGALPLDLDIARGEVVALSGVLGAGKSRLLSAIFGLHPLASGTMLLDGKPYRPRNPRQAIDSGVFMAAEDRHRSSLMPTGWPGSTIAGTIGLPHLARWFPAFLTVGARDLTEADSAIRRLGIKAGSGRAGMETLSGGNQQKVILGRWEAEPCRLLLLDEPFQGVDVGARADIIRAIRSNSRRATLIATSDPEEAHAVADRIIELDHYTLRPKQAVERSDIQGA